MGGYEHGHTASTRGHRMLSSWLRTAQPTQRWCGAGSDPTDPASPRMKQADIYSILKQRHQIWRLQPPSGKDDAPGNAAVLHCPAQSLWLPAHFQGSLRANFDGVKSKHTAPAFLELFLCFFLRDLIQIKASQTQGFPSFSAGVSLPCMSWS